ncbi:MAG: LTA synthase family protein [Candidatus Metalachnospira sp.]|nr:LTA synthase family protein [Candidatus Metalachnospira sp.]
MNINLKKILPNIKKIRPNIKISLLIIFIFSLLTTGFMFYLSPGSMGMFLNFSFREPVMLLLNYIPVILIMLLMYFITGNSIFSSIFSAALFSAFSFTNRMKIEMRQDPLVPSDLTVFGEVKSVVSKFDPFYVRIGISVILVFVLLFIVSLVVFGKNDALAFKNRIIGITACTAATAVLFSSAYSSKEIYDNFQVDGNTYFKVNHYISKGFLYSFIYDINNLKVGKPDGYNSAEFDEIDMDADYSEYEKTSKPNIVMIMSESFSDVSNSDNISFDGYENPLAYYNDFVSRDDVISGHIVVPNFGGGTSDTEFDVLTACSTRYINSSQMSYNILSSKLESIPNLLKNIGYDTLAIHPGYGWFYNRINVYNYLGFDNFQYLETSFDPSKQNKGGYISDAATTESIIHNFEKHTEESDSPLFEFCVTIQNHGPYGDKYGDLPANFSTDVPLSSAEKTIYTGYYQGITDADAQVEALVKYFEASDEPVVLVFFGDHLPGFSNGTTYFSQFRNDIDLNGTIDQQLKAYETPYFIWANKAARETTDFDKNAESLDLPLNHNISSSFLGAAVMDLLDLGNISPFISYANEIRKTIPIAAGNIVMTQNGLITTDIDSDEQSILNKYSRWIYYKLFDD